MHRSKTSWPPVFLLMLYCFAKSLMAVKSEFGEALYTESLKVSYIPKSASQLNSSPYKESTKFIGQNEIAIMGNNLQTNENVTNFFMVGSKKNIANIVIELWKDNVEEQCAGQSIEICYPSLSRHTADKVANDFCKFSVKAEAELTTEQTTTNFIRFIQRRSVVDIKTGGKPDPQAVTMENVSLQFKWSTLDGENDIRSQLKFSNGIERTLRDDVDRYEAEDVNFIVFKVLYSKKGCFYVKFPDLDFKISGTPPSVETSTQTLKSVARVELENSLMSDILWDKCSHIVKVWCGNSTGDDLLLPTSLCSDPGVLQPTKNSPPKETDNCPNKYDWKDYSFHSVGGVALGAWLIKFLLWLVPLVKQKYCGKKNKTKDNKNAPDYLRTEQVAEMGVNAQGFVDGARNFVKPSSDVLAVNHMQVVPSPSVSVNLADINQLQGVYPVKPALPAVGGNEGCGMVEACGSEVKDLKMGDMVIPAQSGLGTRCTHGIYKSDQLFSIDSTLPMLHAAQLQVNPPTAYRMLTDFVSLAPGDVVVQNGANSSVGRYVIQICRNLCLKSINVVRDREDISSLNNELKSLGANEVFTEEFAKVSRGLTDVKLALNCVGGRSSLLLARVLITNGCMVSYGGMSKQPVQSPTGSLIFNDISLRGFWMPRRYEKKENLEERKIMYKVLADWIKSDKLNTPSIKEHSIENFSEAISLANSSGGKQMFVF